MYSYPSRSEKRQTQLCVAAEKGCFSIERMLLYSSEIRKLEKQGFSIFNVEPSSIAKGLFSVTISWSHAYKDGIPHIVFSYITGVIVTYPENSVKNFAQKLYITAKTANRK